VFYHMADHRPLTRRDPIPPPDTHQFPQAVQLKKIEVHDPMITLLISPKVNTENTSYEAHQRGTHIGQ
jgi:hypothetical protein